MKIAFVMIILHNLLLKLVIIHKCSSKFFIFYKIIEKTTSAFRSRRYS